MSYESGNDSYSEFERESEGENVEGLNEVGSRDVPNMKDCADVDGSEGESEGESEDKQEGQERYEKHKEQENEGSDIEGTLDQTLFSSSLSSHTQLKGKQNRGINKDNLRNKLVAERHAKLDALSETSKLQESLKKSRNRVARLNRALKMERSAR